MDSFLKKYSLFNDVINDYPSTVVLKKLDKIN